MKYTQANAEHRSEADNSNIHIYDGHADGKPLHTLSKMHSKPVHIIEVSVVDINIRTMLMIPY